MMTSRRTLGLSLLEGVRPGLCTGEQVNCIGCQDALYALLGRRILCRLALLCLPCGTRLPARPSACHLRRSTYRMLVRYILLDRKRQ